jgi:hypothetical protein
MPAMEFDEGFAGFPQYYQNCRCRKRKKDWVRKTKSGSSLLIKGLKALKISSVSDKERNHGGESIIEKRATGIKNYEITVKFSC